MATKNTILGTVPKSRGRYTEGDTTTKWYYDNILEYKGSSFRCISEASTGITGAPATYNSDTHTLVPNAGWEFFVDTTSALDVEERLAENEEKLSELETEVIYDVTANNNGMTFASLSTLLSSENLSTLIPVSVRCGGMNIRFIQTSDNKYVQYRLTASIWSTDIHDWTSEDPYFIDKIMQEVNEAIDEHTPIEIRGDVTNAPDEEDLTSVNQGGTDVLKFKDKTYNPLTYSGMGRKILRKNIVNGVNTLTQSMINQANTVYVIQYDFTLGEDITVPANCVLEFDGGSISGNGTGKDIITGTDTQIAAPLVKIFSTNINLVGTWNTEGHIRWFGAKPENSDNALAIQKCLDSFDVVRIDGYIYNTTPLEYTKARTIKGENTFRDSTTLMCKVQNGESALLFHGVGNPYFSIEGVIFRVYGKSSNDAYAEGTTCLKLYDSLIGSSVRLTNCSISYFENALLSNHNSYYNNLFKTRFSCNHVCLKSFSVNNLTLDSCIIDLNDFIIDDIQGTDLGVTRIINCSIENTTACVINAEISKCNGQIVFENNHVEQYSGKIFGGFLDRIVEIGNIYYIAGSMNRISYLYDTLSIVSIGNKVTVGLKTTDISAEFEQWHLSYKTGQEGLLQNVTCLNNNVYYQLTSGQTFWNDYGIVDNTSPRTVVVGYSPTDNRQLINSATLPWGTTSRRPQYNGYAGIKTYYDTDIKKMLYWYGIDGIGGWYDAAGAPV